MRILIFHFSIVLYIVLKCSASQQQTLSSDDKADDIDELFDKLKYSFDSHLEKNLDQLQSDFYTAVSDNNKDESINNDGSSLATEEMETKFKRNNIVVDHHIVDEEYRDSIFYPSYPCDRYVSEVRTCINIRQIGTTLTIGVKTRLNSNYHIRWFRHFQKKSSPISLKEEFTKDNSPWNINIGGEQYNELTIFPITETDFSFNYFIATIESLNHNAKKMLRSSTKYIQNKKRSKITLSIKFSIEPIDIDMGALYLGEGIDINPRSFMELPKKSVHLEWFLKEGETLIYSFPSYIQKSDDGNSIIIKELRDLTNTILTCAVYSNKDIFLARRNFFFRNIAQANYPKISLFNEKSSIKRRRKRSSGSDEGFNYDFDNEKSSTEPKDTVKIFQRLFYDYINQQPPSYLKLEHTANSRMQSPYTPPDQFRIDKEIFYGRESGTESPSVKKAYNDVPPFPEIYYDPEILPNKQNLFHIRESSLSNEFSQRHSLSFPNDDNLALELEEEAKLKKYTFDDNESKLIAYCNNKLDCNGNAICRIENDGKNFCKCRSGHYGNGLFCLSLKNLLF